MKAVLRSYNWFFWRTETDRILTLSMIFSVQLVCTRIVYTGQFTFLFMIWNLFLAWLPYAVTSWLQQRTDIANNGWKLAAVFLVWLPIVPNSFYILTDLFHLGKSNVPRWFDLALIVSFAWNGLVLGILSVRQMEKAVEPYLRGRHELFYVYPVMWLNALGIYIGRYYRFNSWDIVANPFDLMAGICSAVVHPLQYKDVWGMVGCFSVFMTLVYLTVKRIARAV
jgi:Predicted membrane protein